MGKIAGKNVGSQNFRSVAENPRSDSARARFRTLTYLGVKYCEKDSRHRLGIWISGLQFSETSCFRVRIPRVRRRASERANARGRCRNARLKATALRPAGEALVSISGNNSLPCVSQRHTSVTLTVRGISDRDDSLLCCFRAWLLSRLFSLGVPRLSSGNRARSSIG